MTFSGNNFESLHDPRFDAVLAEATDFTANTLGLQVADRSHVAIVGQENADAVRQTYGISPARVGAYDEATGRVLVFESAYVGMPNTTRLRLGATAAHELTHSAGVDSDYAHFYNEAFAGIGEFEFLANQRGAADVAADFTLSHAGLVREHDITMPGTFRYLDTSEDALGATWGDRRIAYSSSGLIAALGLQYGQRASGITNQKILDEGKTDIQHAFHAMRTALNSLKPGLWKIFRTMPETTAGLVSGTALIESVAKEQGLTL